MRSNHGEGKKKKNVVYNYLESSCIHDVLKMFMNGIKVNIHFLAVFMSLHEQIWMLKAYCMKYHKLNVFVFPGYFKSTARILKGMTMQLQVNEHNIR